MPRHLGTILCLTLCLGLASLRAQTALSTGPDLTALFNNATASFNSGNFQQAITNAKGVLDGTKLDADATPADKAKLAALLEPMYFTLGAAYFYMKDYATATTALQDYVGRYPQGARVAEAQFALAQAAFFNKDYAKAAKAFAALEGNPKYREDALLLEGLSYHEASDLKNAVAALERLTGGGIRSQTTARGGMQLIAYYSEQKQTDKAFKMLANIQENIAQVENIVELNNIALGQGDTFLNAEKWDEALTCYRAVRVRSEVLALQQERLAAAQRKLLGIQAAIQAAVRENRKDAAGQYVVVLRQTQDTVAEDTKLLADFSKLPPIRPKLLYRMGRAFSGMGKPWEALVVYNDSLELSKDAADREPALYAQINTYVDVNQPKLGREASEKYIKEFPAGPNKDTVGYLLGATALQEGDAKAAEGYFGRMLAEQPASTLREEMKFQLGVAQFNQGDYEKAKGTYKNYLSEYKTGAHTEDATYRLALCDLFAGKYDLALDAIEAYLKKYPGTSVEPDALYRRAVCLYAYKKYDETIKACQEWVKKYPGDQQQGEVEALLGDSYAAIDKTDEALGAYDVSYKTATTDEVLNYSIMEASKIRQKKGDWEGVGQMFEEFVKDHPDHPTNVAAAFWIGRAKSKLGKVDEAKQFIAEMTKKYIDDPKKEAVEQLLSQLVSLCVRKKPVPKPAETPADTAVAGASPSGSPAADAAALAAAATPTPTPTPEPAATPAPDPGAELDGLLGAAEKDRSPTARARILYAKGQLATMRRQPAEFERNMLAVASEFKPEALSSVILGQIGDVLLARNRPDDATPFYQHLMEYYPKSDVVDFGYAGLGEIAFQKKQYDKALGYFEDGVNKVAANIKLKELTVGQAKTLLVLKRYDESKKLFEQAASVREWRGETTAFSVYSLGEVEAQQNKWAEANAYYTRVFVAYQKFLPWVAKAYIGSGQCFEKLGKNPEAIRTYQEMLRNPKLSDLPEASIAKERLAALGAS